MAVLPAPAGARLPAAPHRPAAGGSPAVRLPRPAQHGALPRRRGGAAHGGPAAAAGRVDGLARAGMDGRCADKVRATNRELVVGRLRALRPSRTTVDFDGSVLGTKRRAEGTAVDDNPARKGQRSYWPLFATLAQTSQALDMLHRPGNMADSTGAQEFIDETLARLRGACPERGWRRSPTAPASARFSSTCSSGTASTTPCPCSSSASRRSSNGSRAKSAGAGPAGTSSASSQTGSRRSGPASASHQLRQHIQHFIRTDERGQVDEHMRGVGLGEVAPLHGQ